MAGYANVTLVGNLGRDPETKYLPSGAMNVAFSLGINRRRGQEEIANWYNVTAWGKLAEILNDLVQNGSLAKGKQVLVAGPLTIRPYTDRNGVERFSNDVNAVDVQLLGQRERTGGSGQAENMDEVPF